MKLSTVVHIAARNIGDATDSPYHLEAPFIANIKSLIEWLSLRSMNNRFEIIIGRNKDDTLLRILGQKSSGGQSKTDLIDSIFNDMNLADEEFEDAN